MEQGIRLQGRSDYAGADVLLAEAEDLARRSGASRLFVPTVLANRAAGYSATGRHRPALDALLEALCLDEEMDDVRSQAGDLNMLGLTYLDVGDLETARPYLEKSYRLASEHGLTRFAAEAATNLAIVMERSGDYEQAAEVLGEVGQFWAEAGDESNAACVLTDRGLLAARTGDLDRAAELLTRARDLHRETGHWLHMVQDQVNLSNLESTRGDLAAALATARSALATATEQGLIQLMWYLEFRVAQLGVILAHSAAEAGGVGEAEAMAAFDDALQGLRRAADIIELLRTNIGRPEERQWLFADKEEVYETAIRLCLASGRGAEAFRFCERVRARAFLDSLGAERLRRLDATTASGAARQEYVARLFDPATSAGERTALLSELRAMRARTVAEQPATASITEAELPSVEEICAAIPEDARLVSYFVMGGTLLIFTLGRDGVLDAGQITAREPFAGIVGRLRGEIDDLDAGLPSGSVLFEALIRPVAPHLVDDGELIVVPHQALHQVPFSALWYHSRRHDRRVHLRDGIRTALLPSASALPFLAGTREPERYGVPLVLGDPTGDLPGAAEEARRVAEVIGVRELVGAEANRAALLGPEPSPPAASGREPLAPPTPLIVHVAAHGTHDPDDPLLSGLHLADGVVTVEDLIERGPAPRLLVLSGCFTGASTRRPGDELTGLAHAALRGRTRAVVATLWETSDEPSVLFFERFYEALGERASVGRALEWARGQVAEIYPDALDWAPYVLFGDPHADVADHIGVTVSEEDMLAMRERGDRGESLAESGRFAEALRILGDARADQARLLGGDHPETLFTIGRLACAPAMSGRLDEAAGYFAHAASAAARVLGPEDPLTESLRDNLAQAREQLA
ncbi:hypothetical protein Skr01_19680 [Sphaerisporangium krabiense]|uniref:Tetratricopeptide (TPR) repeat protein n=1 Tax=Sphaerisporangium krabiense TaxID=763782 RepID=A0A7W8Z5I6_9ACTN|nr:CHAT domain-containing protein [Sphaerisporangium krabiense]MBB5627725.1 tetratricopeptide (TPR) repeat protein [Sphaerisporangium krabiense]GII61883.1 hypothetical protein Skr01_19680 [Sphaerisporangium krabiense]